MNTIDDRIIELQELRIGNLLEYKGDLVQVTSLSCDIDDEYQEQICFVNLGASMNERGGWNRSLVNDLKRIPLTSEWLIKCGLKLRKEDNVWQIQVGNTSYLEIENDEPMLAGITPESWRDQCPIYIWGQVKYLHQLQTLYFTLTGEELIIKEIV
jgi:hypothetical protein